MSKLNRASFNNLMIAYQKYLNERTNHNNYTLENDFLKGFESYMFGWDGNSDLRQEMTLTGNLSFSGPAKIGEQSKTQYETFVKHDRTKGAILQLLDWKREYAKGKIRRYQLEGRILHSEYFSNITSFELTARPKVFIHKFIFSMFPELFTTILQENKLKEAAEKVGLETENLNYIQKQFMVRGRIDDFLQLTGLYKDTGKFDGMSIAWFLIQ